MFIHFACKMFDLRYYIEICLAVNFTIAVGLSPALVKVLQTSKYKP